MRKIYQLLLLVGICGGTALTSCNRATYVFQPNTVTYGGDAAQTSKRPSRATLAPAAPNALPQAVAEPMPAPTAVAPHAKQSAIWPKLGQPQKKAGDLLAQRVAAEKIVKRAAKILSPQRNTAERTPTQPKAKTLLLQVAGTLMALGLLLFIATVAANPALETGLLLLAIALVSFITGAVLLLVGLFRKN